MIKKKNVPKSLNGDNNSKISNNSNREKEKKIQNQLQSESTYKKNVCVHTGTLLCPTLCDPMGWSLPVSSAHGMQ